MREIRLSGSEGGGVVLSLPLSSTFVGGILYVQTGDLP